MANAPLGSVINEALPSATRTEVNDSLENLPAQFVGQDPQVAEELSTQLRTLGVGTSVAPRGQGGRWRGLSEWQP
jgi:hypothetical protein